MNQTTDHSPSRLQSIGRAAALLASLICCSNATAQSLEQLLDWMTGDFDNLEQFANQTPPEADAEPLFSPLGLQRRRVDAPALGDVVVYAQINRRADPNDVYRQSLQVLTPAADHGFIGTFYRLKDPEQHRELLSNPDAFSTLTLEDVALSPGPGCTAHWVFYQGVWRSQIRADQCVIRSRRDGSPRHIQATEWLYPDQILNEESGYTATGEQLFGLPEDTYYRYQRRSTP